MHIVLGVTLSLLGGASFFVGMQTGRATRGMIRLTAALTMMALGIVLIAAGPPIITS